ncbi:splicing factor [Salix suchowensis]|uniref:SPLICEOSOME ASSOCIATED PROTEIN 114/SWAP SPLICING FACTOR-RELATED n=2 Tax=Salix TaxID=40685 RepID=A0A9Q0SM36_9ROSI|nr:splicing factor [Salix suchowensis]KAJ6682412.1 SPLICEOSOME ASSOCIATED PROTEIN 114/SWAP SPLICING FACTOR-RELATED [Salix koriyanagi]
MSSTAILPLPAPPVNGDGSPLPMSQVVEQQPRDDKPVSEEQSRAPVATHTRTIGIIHPPPDIRSIVDKTSQFVAKNGPEFEKRIIANNANNAKFNFLNSSDPYHAYYQHRLAEFRAQNQAPGQQPTSQPADSAAPDSAPKPDSASDGNEAATKPDPAAQFRLPPPKVLEPPEAEQYTVRLPEGITGEELDIIKLTAQFVARNGQAFLTGLTNREMNNPQFHFLKPTHSMFTFFTGLADAYSKVLMPPKGLTEKLTRSVPDMTTVLERGLHRLEWERSQEQARQKAEDEIEQERMQMAMIDWHDFVVVETIDFADDEDEDLPPPMTLEEVIRRSKISAMDEDEIIEPGKEVEMEMDEEEMQLVEEGMKVASIEENDDEKGTRRNEEQEPPMRIVKNWKRPEERIAAERDPTKFVVSPITGELIPISEMSEHMRISLIDPKYKEQKERMFAKIRETTLAQDDEISRNIVGLARLRPDIFGTTEEEVSNAVKAEIEKKKDEQPKQVIWDGHTGSIGRTANQAMSQNANGEDQNEAVNNDVRNLPGPAAPPPRPGMLTVRPLPPPPGLQLNLPRVPPNTVQYSGPTAGAYLVPPQRPVNISIMQPNYPPPPMQMASGQQTMMVNRPPPMPPSMSGNPNVPVPPPPGSQYNSMAVPRSFVPHPVSQPGLHMMPPPPPFPQGMPPPPPPDDAPPPLPDEPEPKRQRLDDSALVPEDQFLAQHPGLVHVTVAVPNLDEGNLKGQVLEIAMQSLSETVGSLKEKIAGEIQLPANKQKLSGKAGFLKDNMSLAYYNVGPGESLALSLRERGGRKR